MRLLPLALLLLAPVDAADDARNRAVGAADLSVQASSAKGVETMRAGADAAFSGTVIDGEDGAVFGRRSTSGRLRLARAKAGEPDPLRDPPRPLSAPGRSGVSTGLVLAGGAALGALQGFLSAGLIGAAAGGVLGFGAAWLYSKGHPAAAFGSTAGGIIGSAIGGPLGGLVGAVVGAGLGYLIGGLFGL